MGVLKRKAKPTTKAPAKAAPKSSKTETPQPIELCLHRINADGQEQVLLNFMVMTDDGDRTVGLLNAGLQIRYTITRGHR